MNDTKFRPLVSYKCDDGLFRIRERDTGLPVVKDVLREYGLLFACAPEMYDLLAEYQRYGSGRPWADRVDAVLLKVKGDA